MTALGMTALHLRIVDFKFTHNFHDLQQATRHGNYFWHRCSKEVLNIIHAWDKEKNCYIQRDGKFLTYTRPCEQKATIGTVKSSLKIPPRHDGVIPIKFTGPAIKDHMAYFITDENSTKGRDPNINIISGIHCIKGKTSVNVLVSNYIKQTH